jgi:carboxyl-terminal processing protease
LRGNPGGSLSDAIEIADLFLPSGTIVSTRGRNSPPEAAEAKAEGTLPDFPMVVLVNGQSASASEVLSGALAENKRAIVVGTRTFGKGLVQGVMTVPGTKGGQLKLTEARYYLPSGRSIHRTDDAIEWGVDPSDGYCVPLTDEETLELVRVRREEEVIARDPHAAGEGAQNWSDPAWILDRLKDKQLAAAMRAVQGRVDTGEWTPTGEPNPAGSAVAGQELARAVELRERWLRELTRLDRRIEALESSADPDAAAAGADFWDDAIDLTGGTLRVTDKDGNPVATLRITGNNLERWLLDADVTTIKDE